MNTSHSYRDYAAAGLPAILCGLAMLLIATCASAQGFAAYVSPPRYELDLQPGDVSRQVLNIEHTGFTSGNFHIYTNDWYYQSDNSIRFSDELLADSCRPWVTLERHQITVDPNSRYRFRFEIAPPAGSQAVECRFALMVEGLETVKLDQGPMLLPVGGRIAVMVYIALAGADAQLEFLASPTIAVRGRSYPAIEVRNNGLAHGRLSGLLEATLPDGKTVDLTPSDMPILPGQTRVIVMEPQVDDGQSPAPLEFPLTVTGQLEWGKHKADYRQRFSAP